MLRQYLAEPSGYWLVSHPDHARLAGEFASAWGNDLFLKPEPRADVLEAIFCHDDGWRMRDSAPEITREGKPSAFSNELVGKYSAFEEIDLEAYLSVRQKALDDIAGRNKYAAILVSRHTYNLLSARADRTTIASENLPRLDAFLVDQLSQQEKLRAQLLEKDSYPPDQLSVETLEKHFRLLQACDNLSLRTCVDFPGIGSLLHPLATRDGMQEIAVRSLGPRHFSLSPWPFVESNLEFNFPARFVRGEFFSSHTALREAWENAEVSSLTVRLSAHS